MQNKYSLWNRNTRKKAQLADMVYVLVSITVIAVTLLFAGYLYKKTEVGLQDSGLMTNNSQAVYDKMEVAWTIFDGSFVFIIIGIIIGLIVSAFQIPTHPAFIIVNIIGFLFLVILGAVMSNVYGQILDQGDLLNVSGQPYFDNTTYIMYYLPWIGAGICLLVTIVMYSKGRSEGF